jgi:hypothetical protein
MDERTRGRLSLLMLACAGLALIATSPPSHSTQRVDGESVVGPGRPASFEVVFGVAPPFRTDADAEITGGVLVPSTGFDSRYSKVIEVTVDGSPVELAGTSFSIPLDACEEGCEVRARAGLAWVGPHEPDIHLLWSTSLSVPFAAFSSSNAVTVRSAPPPPGLAPVRVLAIGLALGALTVLLWIRAGRRFQRARLAIAAAAVVVPLGILARDAGAAVVGPVMGAGAFGMEALVILLILTALPVPWILYAIDRHRRGRPTVLAVGGWLFGIGFSYVFLAVADGLATYRPIELLALGAAVTMPAAAAITAPGLLPSNGGVHHGRILVLASQAILLPVAVLLGVVAVPGLVLQPLLRGSPDVEGVAIGLAVIGAALLLVAGVIRWRRGQPGVLIIANGLVLLPLGGLAVLLLSFSTQPGAILRGSLGSQLAGLILAGAAAVGFFGGMVAKPPSPAARDARLGTPPSEEERDEEGGKGDQVGGIHDQRDGLEAGGSV